jgi:hypothetical protein
MPTGRLLLADAGETGSELGVLYSISTEGDVEQIARCRYLIDPLDIELDETGAGFVIDRTAAPASWPTSLGAVFHFDTVLVAGPDCSTYLTGPPLVRPSAGDLFYEGTPILMHAFALSETPGGVRISWRPPEDLAGADYYLYRRELEDPHSVYELLNPGTPVRGAGELAYVDVFVETGILYEYILLATLSNGSHLEFGPLSIRVARGPGRFALDRITPNPFPLVRSIDGMTIRFAIPDPGMKVQLGLYDVTGRLLRRLVDEPLEAGRHVILWNGRDNGGTPVGSGVYFLRLEAGPRREHRRVVLLR